MEQLGSASAPTADPNAEYMRPLLRVLTFLSWCSCWCRSLLSLLQTLQRQAKPCILSVGTTPDDPGHVLLQRAFYSHGGKDRSHAAVIARGMGALASAVLDTPVLTPGNAFTVKRFRPCC